MFKRNKRQNIFIEEHNLLIIPIVAFIMVMVFSSFAVWLSPPSNQPMVYVGQPSNSSDINDTKKRNQNESRSR